MFILSWLLSLPSLVFAHERWFVPPSSIVPPRPILFSEWTPGNAAMVLSAFFVFIAALLIHFTLRPHRAMRHIRSRLAAYKMWVSPLLRALIGVLLFTASFSRALFAPDLQTFLLPAPAEQVILAIEFIVGLGLIIGFMPRLMSLIGFTLYVWALFIFPALSVLSYISLAAIFIYLLIVGDPGLPRVKGIKVFSKLRAIFDLSHAKPYAQSILRIVTGIGFVLVAFINKVFDPSAALSIVRFHELNFMPSLGFANFSNEMFVLAAGLVEITVGILLILGLLPRFIGGLLIVLFTITLGIFGVYELVGHLPLYAIAFALLIQGGGERWSAELVRSSVRKKAAAK